MPGIPIRIISIAEIGGEPHHAKTENQKVFVARIWGEVTGEQTRRGRNGPYLVFVGKFEAVNWAGTRYRSEVLTLPGSGGFNWLLDGRGSFGYDFYAEPAANLSGYTYSALKFKASDPLPR